MRMSCVWRNRRPLLRWSLFLFVLIGLGWALYAWLPPQPRWVVHGSFDPLGLGPDGKTIRTWTGTSGRRFAWLKGGPGFAIVDDLQLESHGGPVQFWDVQSGREVRRFVDRASTLDSAAFSDDGQMLYAVARDTAEMPAPHLHRVDLNTGRESQVAIEAAAPGWEVHLSTSGKLLVLSSVNRGIVWDFINGAGTPEHSRASEPQPSFLLLYDAQSLRLLFKEAANSWQWQWAPDGEALLLFAAHETGKASLRRITAQGETIALFDGAGCWRGVTPDGKTLLTDWPMPAGSHDPGPSLLLWGTLTGQRQGEIQRFVPSHSPDIASAFLANGRALVIAQWEHTGPSMAVVWDLEKNAPVDKVPLETGAQIVMSSGRNVFAVYRELWRRGELTLYRPQPMAELWQRDLATISMRPVEFLTGTNRLVTETLNNEGEHDEVVHRIEVLDLETSHTCFRVNVMGQHRLIPRGRYLAIEETIAIPREARGWVKEMLDKCFAMVLRDPPSRAEFETITRVFDTQTGEQLGRLELRGASFVDLSPDGRSIFMQEEDRNARAGSLSCYDVPARAYWVWIIGVPLCAGMLWVALRAGWRRWQHRLRSVGDAASVAASGGTPPNPAPKGAPS